MKPILYNSHKDIVWNPLCGLSNMMKVRIHKYIKFVLQQNQQINNIKFLNSEYAVLFLIPKIVTKSVIRFIIR
jgi:hypothetical protein